MPTPSFLPEPFQSSEEEHTGQWISISHTSETDPFISTPDRPQAQSSPVRHRLDFEIEPGAESASWAKNVESRLRTLAPTTPKRRSRSVDELGRYSHIEFPLVSDPRRSSSLSRRASAPLLSLKLPPLEFTHTSTAPPAKLCPVGHFSTFHDASNADILRPATAPLPGYEEEQGGVHYSTYGSRISQIYDHDPFSDSPPLSMPFASAAVPIPPLAIECQDEHRHKRTGSLATALLRRVGSVPSSPATPTAVIESRSRKATIATIAPRDDRPTTPAPEEEEKKLKTRPSLLSVALGSLQNSHSGATSGHDSSSCPSPARVAPTEESHTEPTDEVMRELNATIAEFGGLPEDRTTSPRTRTWSKLSARALAGLTKRQSITSNRSRLDSFTRRPKESLTRRKSADALAAEGATEGTVMYGVGEEMLRLMFGGAGSSLGEQGQALEPRERTRSLPRRVSPSPRPRGDQSLLEKNDHVESFAPDFGPPLDLQFSNPGPSRPAVPPRRKAHKRQASSKENARVKPRTKSRARARSAPLGNIELAKPGILMNGVPTTPRKTVRSNPTPTPEKSNPGVVVTAATPPAGPVRSMSMPMDASGSVSRGTFVQFVVPESQQGSRRVRRKEDEVEDVKGKRKEVADVPESGRESPTKKPRLDEDEMLFGGVAQVKRGRGSVDRASSHQSVRSTRRPQAKSPSPRPASPDVERTSIPMRAIVTPRVQSLYGAPPTSEYVLRRPSLGDIQRPRSHISGPRPMSQASARSNESRGVKSNVTSARSHVRSNAGRSNVTGATGVSHATSRIKLKDRLPFQGWCFVVGFLIPFVWWYASFTRAERGYYGGGVWSRDVEAKWEGVKTRRSDYRDSPRADAHAWRFRCRLMAVASLVIYIPVIVLAAVFAR